MNTSLDLIAVSGASNSANIFSAYVQWGPCDGSGVASDLTLSNAATLNAQIYGTIPAREETAWKSLYGKTKLCKIVVQYFPAVTEGINQAVVTSGIAAAANSLSQAAVMYTIPIYDNVDDIISTTGAVVAGQTRTDLEDNLNKPYTKCHSIYKRWTRIIKPKFFMSSPTYDASILFSKRGGFVDLSTDAIDLNGLYIAMPPLTVGGLQANASALNQSTYPSGGQRFVLGRLQFTYYQKFMTRE